MVNGIGKVGEREGQRMQDSVSQGSVLLGGSELGGSGNQPRKDCREQEGQSSGGHQPLKPKTVFFCDHE